MNLSRFSWALGLIAAAAIVVTPIVLVTLGSQQPDPDPWSNVPERPPQTDHSDLLPGPYESGEDVTAACLACHPDAAGQVMGTEHFTWLSEPVEIDGEVVRIGKANQINNYCIGVQGNWQRCATCHAGYGWEDETFFETATETNVDCLVCHAGGGTYAKGAFGYPAAEVDLAAAAQSVGTPSRENCGSCHFYGGGGNGVKHGDLDQSLTFPTADIDVHMGQHDFQCVDCHTTTDHQISGHSISVSVENTDAIACTDCHTGDVHVDDRIDAHTAAVACQTCHIPQGAVRDATKTHWDWSQAGDPDREEHPHEYLRIKGEFVYESNFTPEYAWFNGTADRYLLGDLMDPNVSTPINMPLGDINDPTAQIWPFKVHRAIQPYDDVNNILLQPKTVGEGGYWENFNWDLALTLGSEIAGLEYSGSYGFAPTEMYWHLTHMVVPGEQALQCADCHSENGRLDWQALGYFGDPIYWGGRDTVQTGEGGQ
ncbi:MAG: tetrathionate reductase family octaheme c-type cytochrome [Chloroflexi bacterium]|nr:tetrathionate reductase family octaheme c-type cytochrome [Chloroflexota bacterium]